MEVETWIISYVVWLFNSKSLAYIHWLFTAELADGLCFQLLKACPKEPEVIPFKELEINRSEIQLMKKLGAGQFGEVWAGMLLTFLFIVIFR